MPPKTPILVYVTDDERARLQRAADLAERSLSSFCRLLLLGSTR